MAGIASSFADLEAWENELFDRYNDRYYNDRYNGEYEEDRKENDHEEMEA